MENGDLKSNKLLLTIPFPSDETASLARDVLSVDKELKGNLLKKTISVDGSNLIVEFYSADLKLLRVASNAFLKNIVLVVKTIKLLQ
ncbi:unnamed protein product [Plutella xylostella]|uniref:L antigen family member 3 n=1 Tax=Plutella xylostella TaxID=51655 RepID=A0A8S4EFU7_PLUXY|nr:unnamed protein product [Plutella xylostella]